MKICYFVYDLGSYSGAAFQALNLAKRLIDPVLIFNVGSPFIGLAAPHIQVVNVAGGAPQRFFKITWQLLRSNVKVIHFHGQFLLPMLIAKTIGIPYVLKTTLLGDDDFDSLLKKRFGALRLWLSKRCSMNIVLSSRLFKINSKHLDSSKIKLVPNGVTVTGDSPSLPEKRNYFYFCGVISKRKQTLKSIKVFAENYAHLHEAKLFVIGPEKNYGLGKEVDAAYIDECRRYVSEAGLSGKVEFTGLLPQDEVLRVIRRCKALLFFSDFEGMPNVVLEAMASNCVPIISTMQGVGYELIGDGAGFVCNDVVPKINEIDQTILCHLPFKRAASCYSFEASADALSKIYIQCAHLESSYPAP